MNKAVVGWSRIAVWLCAGLTVAATASTAVLYHRNELYLNTNRQLLLQNDSIMAVNIELQKALQHKAHLPQVLTLTGTYKSRQSK